MDDDKYQDPQLNPFLTSNVDCDISSYFTIIISDSCIFWHLFCFLYLSQDLSLLSQALACMQQPEVQALKPFFNQSWDRKQWNLIRNLNRSGTRENSKSEHHGSPYMIINLLHSWAGSDGSSTAGVVGKTQLVERELQWFQHAPLAMQIPAMIIPVVRTRTQFIPIHLFIEFESHDCRALTTRVK